MRCCLRTGRLQRLSAFAAAALALAPFARAQRLSAIEPATPDRVVVIHCGRLLAAPGEPPMQRATIVVKNDRIAEVMQGLRDPKRYEGANRQVQFVDLSDRFVLPGLIDSHVHLTGQMDANSRLRAVEASDADNAIAGVVFAQRTLDAGFTTVRDVGASGDAIFALRDAINAGLIPGPRILAAGEAITPTGGHGDATNGYREDLFDLPGVMQGVADGPYEARKAVRAQVKRGADVIKLTATGGVLSATKAGTDQQFFDDELEAIVQTAHSLGRKVAAHAHGADGIKAALKAGVDSIEHGSFLDDEAVSLFRQTGAYLVPTLLAGETVSEIARSESNYFVPAVREKALAVGPAVAGAFRRALEGGVKIAFGTDSGVSRHGENAREFELMVAAGMTPAQAIEAATVSAATLLGLADELGTIQPGKSADIIAVDGDPLQDVAALRRMAFVMRRGEIRRAPIGAPAKVR